MSSSRDHHWVIFKVSKLMRCSHCRLLHSVFLRRLKAGKPSPCDPNDVARHGLSYLSEEDT